MKDGTEIALKDMSDSHIQNAMRMLWRAISEIDEAICSVDAEMVGSFAIATAQEDSDKAMEWVRAFQKEIKRRTK